MSTDFQISCSWSKRPEPYETRDDLDLHPSLDRAMDRFFALYAGEFTVPLEGGALTFSLEYDFAFVCDDLPGWLRQLGSRDGEATLFFASQGTEMALAAVREGGTILLSARSLVAHRPLPKTLRPIAVPASRFFSAWAGFVETVLDAIAKAEPGLMQNADVREYRAAINAAAPAQPGG
jgi:hypothetical protein